MYDPGRHLIHVVIILLSKPWIIATESNNMPYPPVGFDGHRRGCEARLEITIIQNLIVL